jgi:competence protein CoiA
MQYAVDVEGQRIFPTYGALAFCPLCKHPVRSKCGSIKVHHWAHVERASDCDPWWEPESLWHREFKKLFEPSRLEVSFNGHRADVLTPNNLVIELQSSPISSQVIAERETCYNNMIWVLNGEKFWESIFLYEKLNSDSAIWKFKWKRLKKSWGSATRPVFIHLGSKRIVEILGVKSDLYLHYYDSDGQEQFNSRMTIDRCGLTTHSVTESELESNVLLIRTLHPNGFGTAQIWTEYKLRDHAMSATKVAIRKPFFC